MESISVGLKVFLYIIAVTVVPFSIIAVLACLLANKKAEKLASINDIERRKRIRATEEDWFE